MSFVPSAAARQPLLRPNIPVEVTDPSPPPPVLARPPVTSPNTPPAALKPPDGTDGPVLATVAPLPQAAGSAPNGAQGATNFPANAPQADQVAQPKVVGAPQTPALAPKPFDDFTYNSEARTDAQGNPIVYHPPANDGSGGSEIAGFTIHDNPQQLAILQATPLAQRRDVVLKMMNDYTAPAAQWAQDPAVQGLVRDITFNRGPGGAQAIIAQALGAPAGARTAKLAPEQIQALNQMDPLDAINALTKARSDYETNVVGVRPNLAKGLNNRFNNAQAHFTKLYLAGDQS